MRIDDLETKVKDVYEDVKSGKVARDVKHEARDVMYDVQNLGLDVKDRIVDVAHDLKKDAKQSINNIKNKF